MTGLIVFIAVIVAVLGLMVLAWSKRGQIRWRGVGAAGAQYNRWHGFPEGHPESSVTVATESREAPNHPSR